MLCDHKREKRKLHVETPIPPCDHKATHLEKLM